MKTLPDIHHYFCWPLLISPSSFHRTSTLTPLLLPVLCGQCERPLSYAAWQGFGSTTLVAGLSNSVCLKHNALSLLPHLQIWCSLFLHFLSQRISPHLSPKPEAWESYQPLPSVSLSPHLLWVTKSFHDFTP